METYIPEGLHRQSATYIANWIAKAGFNCVRLTYSIDMALHSSTPLDQAFPNAAMAIGGHQSELQAMYDAVIKLNPALASPEKTVLDVYTAVINALSAANVMVVLDNHVSHASWCCNKDDGNGWFDDGRATDASTKYFVPDQWLSGITAMATYSVAFENVVGLSLRNEFHAEGDRKEGSGALWADMVTRGGTGIHAANPGALIMIGGLQYATDLSWLRHYPLDLTPFGNKAVMEYHRYPFAHWSGNCGKWKKDSGTYAGFVLQQNKKYTAPLWLSEFGVALDGGASSKDLSFIDCVREYMEDNDADWAIWALQGSYYVRQGIVDMDEGYGMLDHGWTDWRNSSFPARLGKMWEVTQGPPGTNGVDTS